MKIKLSKKRKLELVKELINKPGVFYGTSENSIIDLLDMVFDLRNKPSEDNRFNDAYEDAVQHLLNNNDWELEYTLLTRFDITDGDSIIDLIEFLVRPDFITSEQERLDLVDNINSLLNFDGYSLETFNFNEEDKPLFNISSYDPSNKYPAGVVKNKIRFFPNYDIKDIDKFKTKERNILILDFKNYNWWNDYSLMSKCNLIFRDLKGDLQNFGELKIITDDDDNYSESQDPEGNYKDFHPILPDNFTELDSSYCSLGQTKEYYHSLKTEFKTEFRSILYSLRDAALFTDIADIFEKDSYFKQSLIRKDRAERVLREIKFELNGRDRADMYKFIYLFSPQLGIH